MKRSGALVLLLVFNSAWACSCIGISSIDDTIAKMPLLVEAQVISLEQEDTEYGRQTHSATLKVKRMLKGNISSDAITVEHWMCYASVYPDLMEVGHTYVLPLTTPSDGGRYQLGPCAHSGMELVDGKLYSFESAGTGERRRQFHTQYSDLVRRLSR